MAYTRKDTGERLDYLSYLLRLWRPPSNAFDRRSACPLTLSV
jgi:hypothetical protein